MHGCIAIPVSYCNATLAHIRICAAIAFSSEVDTGSCEGNASRQRREQEVLIRTEPVLDARPLMSEDWNTKYGTRRVRRDPPTLEEAIFAAVGITDDQEAQAEIASALMGLPYEDVLAEVKKTARSVARSATRVIAGEHGAQRSVVVERRVIRRFSNDKRTGT
jgi:hypothetical protein